MAVHFTKQRWEKIRETYGRWWAEELERPLISVTVRGCDPDRNEPLLPFHHSTAQYGLETPAQNVVDVWDYRLSTQRWLGDGFPAIWPNFGPGVLAAFLGAQLEARDETVWFHPATPVEIGSLSLTYDSTNQWLERVKVICEAAMQRWEGLVQVGMTDLGGNLDILSSFRPSENLLVDLCTEPEQVKRVTWEAHDAWWHAFDALNGVLQPVNPGYTAWTPIFSADPYYMLQCDFCYMIGPDMFDEFVKPELAASCRKLTNVFYHLDGVGQLPHLDSLLSIEELKGVQWVPGSGKPAWGEWPDIYRRIRDAGKLTQVWGPLRDVARLVDELGTGKGIVALVAIEPDEQNDACEFLARYGAT
jgi:hypothetical protein